MYVPHVGWLGMPDRDLVADYLREGWFEASEQAFLWRYLRPGDVMLDCGAHLGLFSVLAGRVMANQGRIISLEPQPVIAAALRDNLARNDVTCATVIEAAAYSTSGPLEFQVHDSSRAAFSSIYAQDETGHTITVEGCSLDDLLEAEGIDRVDFVKLDVEGAEIDALGGCSRSVEAGRLPVVAIEFSEKVLNSANRTTLDLAKAWQDRGYSFFRLNPADLTLSPAEFDGPIWYENLYALLDVEAVRQRLDNTPPESARVAHDVAERGRLSKRLYDAHEERSGQVRDLQQQLDDARHWQGVYRQRVTNILDHKLYRIASKLRLVQTPEWAKGVTREAPRRGEP